jgi:hypothetical protein
LLLNRSVTFIYIKKNQFSLPKTDRLISKPLAIFESIFILENGVPSPNATCDQFTAYKGFYVLHTGVKTRSDQLGITMSLHRVYRFALRKRKIRPAYICTPFHLGKDEYPYPKEAIDITYGGLHRSDKGYAVISKALVKIMRKY